MIIDTRKADKRGRFVLPEDFANQTIIVERLNNNELRLRKKPLLSELLAKITPENLHLEIDAGPAMGNESL